VLYNELHVWNEQKTDMEEKGLKGKELVKPKRFCNAGSGEKDAWCQTGMNLFCKLVGEVKYHRDKSVEFEEKMRDSWARGDVSKVPAHDLNENNITRNQYVVNQSDEEMICNLMSI